VDLNVRFTFSLPHHSVLSMADLSKIGVEPLRTISSFTSDGAAKILFRTIGNGADWGVELPSTLERVCSHFPDHSFPMYEVVFGDVGFRLPLSSFQREVLRWTKLSPAQIHPYSYAFMRAFELVCQHLGVTHLKNFFFALFSVQRGGGFAWVSFRQKEKMIDIFVGKVRSWKERYFLVKPRNVAALNNLLRPTIAPRSASDEAPTPTPYFPLRWSNDHYKFKPNDYGRTVERLSEEERVVLDKLRVYMRAFTPLRSVSTDGEEVSVTRFIDTDE